MTRSLDPKSLAGQLRAHAMGYPGATEDFPWGERAIKVNGKAFLFLRAEGNEVSFSVKLSGSHADALEHSFAEPTHYGLGKHGWVTSTVDARRDAPIELFRAWIDESFRNVAPKRVLAQHDASAGGNAETVANGANASAKRAAKKKPTRSKR